MINFSKYVQPEECEDDFPKRRARAPLTGKQKAFWLALLFGVAAMGAQWYQRHFPSWDEEVQLSDGRMLVVHRAHKINTDGNLIETALTFDLPEIGGQRTWREFLYPAIVDVYAGKAYVVGAVTYKFAGYYRNPRYGYAAFVYSSAGWQRVPFLSLPAEIRERENIAYCDTGVRLTWASKQTGWCSSSGKFEIGLDRSIDLVGHAENAKKTANRANTYIKSE